MKIIYLLILTVFTFLNIPAQTNNKILSADSKLTKIFDGGFFTEGPAVSPEADVYFSDLTFTEASNMQAGIIWKYNSAKGTTVVYRSPSGMANGIEFDQNGNMIVCEGADFGGRRIIRTDIKTGKSMILAAKFNDTQFNSPNDLIIDKKNRIYFTDPRYAGWEEIEQPCFGVYRIDEDGKIELLISDILMPNGIAISPDQKKMYVGCNFEGDAEKDIKPEMAIYVYNLTEDGDVQNKKLFIKYDGDAGPDGITTDKNGNLYVAFRNETGPGIYIYNESANLIEVISLPEVPGNLTFGKGEENNILYITAGVSLYKINLLSEGNN